MGCGASSERKEGEAASDADKAGTGPRDDAPAKYAASASPVPSEVDRLLEEMALRAPSHSSAADEPSEAVKAMRFKAAVTRGKVVNGMTEDPDQFASEIESPEFKRRDRRRVDEWVKLVMAAMAADGPELIPQDSFFFTSPSFSVQFTTSASIGGDGRPLEAPMGRQRSSGGTGTGEFVEDSTQESFGGRPENSSLDHVESGELVNRVDSGESARVALSKSLHRRTSTDENHSAAGNDRSSRQPAANADGDLPQTVPQPIVE